MSIQIYNTMTKKTEPLLTCTPGKISFFVCGPTVYDYAHLGHGKTYTQFDFIVRYLKYRGYKVTYLQNITDIDDKIIIRAAEQKLEPAALAKKYESFYLEEMRALHNTNVDIYARAHDYIDQIVSQIQRLQAQGVAYKIADGYYFDISKFADYGQLSGRYKVQQGDAISRIDENVEKRNPGDFCLWKLHKPDEPCWETELGAGRPGWHIEDTAITERHFGPQYDIHGGAIDLIFPHHEAEIAQMEMVSGRKPLVRYWLHTGFLNMKSEKMSKSSGNFITIRDILQHTNYRVLRYLFLSHHYRSSIDLAEGMLEQASSSLERINIFIQTIDPQYEDKENEGIVSQFKTSFIKLLDHDFDTPNALALLFNFIRAQNKKGQSGRRIYMLMKELNEIFDFFNMEKEFLDEEIEEQLRIREQLRSQGGFAEADAIRNNLTSRGIILEDTAGGLRWRRRT